MLSSTTRSRWSILACLLACRALVGLVASLATSEAGPDEWNARSRSRCRWLPCVRSRGLELWPLVHGPSESMTGLAMASSRALSCPHGRS